MPMNRHLSLLEARVDLLQKLLRSKSCPELSYTALRNVVAIGDGWSDWEDFLDHGRFAVIEKNWQLKTLRALDRLGIYALSLDDLKQLEVSQVRSSQGDLTEGNEARFR